MGIEGIETEGGGEPGVLTRDFVLLFVASCFFIGSLYLLLPILPLYMQDTAGATTTQVGLLIGTLTVSSFLLRPYVGRKADTIGMKAPESRRGQSMAWFQSSFNLGIMLAPLLGEYLMDRFGYTSVFVAASVSAAVSLVTILAVREQKVPDILGEATTRHGIKDIRGIILLVSIAVFAGTATLGSLEAFLALFAKAEGIGRFALFFTISAGLLIALRLLAGSLPDRLGRRLTGTSALVTLAVSMVVMAFTRTFAGLCVAAVIWGAGFAFLSPSLSALLIDHAPADELGSAFGIYTAAFEGGIAFGAIAMGPVVSWLGFRCAFLFIGCVSLVGAVLFASLFPRLAGKGVSPQHG
jgi:MFS family permease